MKKKTLWIISMFVIAALTYTIVSARVQKDSSIIFGGADSGFIQSDSVNFNAVEETPEPTVDIWPKLTLEDFENNDCLALVNSQNLLSSIWTPKQGVSKISGTKYMMFSTEYIDKLNAFLDAAREAGFEPYVAVAYREYTHQKTLYDSKASQIAYNMTGGKTVPYTDPIYAEAAEQAKKITAVPGGSEHQLGVAVDLLDRQRNLPYVYENMNQDFFAFLDEHCAEYGFIKRYPTRKLLLTGWDEPWHYRYVGEEVAKFIMEQGICYEEFYAHYHPDFVY